ncbi:MAG: hypothetical protein QE487_08225 [Fluviicola sp.]|nr:hypothetical protein [Fluviicola sp.]
MKLTALFSGVVIVIAASRVCAQGCSDAGFCTVDALKSPDGDSTVSEKSVQLKLGASVGKADYNITIFASYLEYNRQVNKHWGYDMKLTQLAQFTDSINTNGLGDLFLIGTYKTNSKIAVTAGVKLPFSDGNKQRNGRSLPNDFQSSLGTIDFIGGISKDWRKFRFTAAVQQPLTQGKNRFSPELFDSISVFSTFQSTNGFERRGDVLARMNYTWAVNKHWKLTPGLLAIYHLGEDSYLDSFDVRKPISGSEGLTLNGTLFVHYSINKSHKLEFSAGTPFVVRAVRPDGLTRSFVATLEWKWLFL